MWEVLEKVFGGDFMPHGHCYLWSPPMVWLQVTSNLMIGLAYVAISAMLYLIVSRIRNCPFSWMYLAFGLFILACGGTHFTEVVTVWHPIYWFDGGLRAVTAFASVLTAFLLVPLVPKAVAMAHDAQLSQERGRQLEAAYSELKAAHEKAKQMEQVMAREVSEQTRHLTAELVRLRAQHPVKPQ